MPLAQPGRGQVSRRVPPGGAATPPADGNIYPLRRSGPAPGPTEARQLRKERPAAVRIKGLQAGPLPEDGWWNAPPKACIRTRNIGRDRLRDAPLGNGGNGRLGAEEIGLFFVPIFFGGVFSQLISDCPVTFPYYRAFARLRLAVVAGARGNSPGAPSAHFAPLAFLDARPIGSRRIPPPPPPGRWAGAAASCPSRPTSLSSGEGKVAGRPPRFPRGAFGADIWWRNTHTGAGN